MLDGDGASRSGSQLFYLACRPDRTENVLMMSALSFGMRLKILRQRGFLQLGIPENKLQYTSKLSARKALKSSWLPLPVDLEIVG
jgi:hypothetical protein